jgi:hypothetical protein
VASGGVIYPQVRKDYDEFLTCTQEMFYMLATWQGRLCCYVLGVILAIVVRLVVFLPPAYLSSPAIQGTFPPRAAPRHAGGSVSSAGIWWWWHG